jgi:hypothetical protein
LDEAAVEHEDVLRFAVVQVLAGDEFCFFLMGADVGLYEFDGLCFGGGFEQLSQLFLVDQF